MKNIPTAECIESKLIEYSSTTTFNQAAAVLNLFRPALVHIKALEACVGSPESAQEINVLMTQNEQLQAEIVRLKCIITVIENALELLA